MNLQLVYVRTVADSSITLPPLNKTITIDKYCLFTFDSVQKRSFGLLTITRNLSLVLFVSCTYMFHFYHCTTRYGYGLECIPPT